jgi:hypothetical protein
MVLRTALLGLVLLAGCATSSPQPVAYVTPAPDATSATDTSAARTPVPHRGYRTRPSDVALSVVATPFVFGFRAVVCAASAVVAAPAAALFSVSDDPRDGYAYLRRGRAQNCGPPYAVPLPSATHRAREAQFVRYDPEPLVIGYAPGPDLGPPRPLTPYSGTVVTSP